MQNKFLIILLLWNLLLYQGSCTALQKVSQNPSNILYDFLSYRQISIIRFNVPENAIFAIFKFIAKESKISGIGRCLARSVSIHLKSGSIPLVRPDNSTIKAALLENRRSCYSLQIMSDGVEHDVRIDAPIAGNWYGIAFRSWVDPDSSKITQQGLGATCSTILDTELLVEPASVVKVLKEELDQELNLDAESVESAVVQFYIPENIDRATLIAKSSCADNCTIFVYITSIENLASKIINTTEVSIPFFPVESSIHNVLLRLHTGTASNVSIHLTTDSMSNDKSYVNKENLFRRSFTDFFLFDYEYILGNDTKSAPINVTANTLSVLKFKIGDIFDVGGTVTVGLKFVKEELDKKNMIAVGCVTLGYYSNITNVFGCEHRHSTTPVDIYVNTTEPSYVNIPYPEPGLWYVSIKVFCVENNCPCLEDCVSRLCQNCSCIEECSSQVEIHIASNPCIEGECNKHGKCMHYFSGGFAYSACDCGGGYRGFDCVDDTYLLDSSAVITQLLLLTLSNLAFLGSVILAIRRQYYSEAIAYTAVMFFSTFYHACEAGDDLHNLCIMRLSVLQFCDFYNALLSIWVTLVAMAAFGPRLTSFCQMAGAVVLAVGAELDRTALWVFLLPAVTGCVLIGLFWAIRCRAKGTYSYPARPYRLYYLPAGLVIVFIGLICYAFLQTRRNYYIVHSFWHICVAVGVMLLLPTRQYMDISRSASRSVSESQANELSVKSTCSFLDLWRHCWKRND